MSFLTTRDLSAPYSSLSNNSPRTGAKNHPDTAAHNQNLNLIDYGITGDPSIIESEERVLSANSGRLANTDIQFRVRHEDTPCAPDNLRLIVVVCAK